MLNALIVLAAGAAGGYVFLLLHLPLPWTLGALTAAAILATSRPEMVMPVIVRDGARPVIGVVAGSAFTPAVVAQMATWWPIFPVLIVFFVVTTYAGSCFFRRCGFDRQTALFASMPGGMGEMVLLGMQFGADVRQLVLVHTVRQIVVVTVIPFLLGHLLTQHGGPSAVTGGADARATDWVILLACVAGGYLAGRPLRRFGGMMLAPLAFSALAHASGLTSAEMPYWIVALMQIMIGSITGARFAGLRIREAYHTVLIGLVWVVLLLMLSSTLAVLITAFMDQPPAAIFLALSPGGFSEMVVIAYASGIEVAFVVTCHVFRTIYILLVSPLLSQMHTRERR